MLSWNATRRDDGQSVQSLHMKMLAASPVRVSEELGLEVLPIAACLVVLRRGRVYCT